MRCGRTDALWKARSPYFHVTKFCMKPHQNRIFFFASGGAPVVLDPFFFGSALFFAKNFLFAHHLFSQKFSRKMLKFLSKISPHQILPRRRHLQFNRVAPQRSQAAHSALQWQEAPPRRRRRLAFRLEFCWPPCGGGLGLTN